MEENKTEENNVIFVGKKSTMAYVLATMTQFTKTSSVVIKARGRATSRAIDVVEVVRNRYMPNAIIKNIVIKTEEVQSKPREGETEEEAKKRGSSKVSAIEITLEKPPF